MPAARCRPKTMSNESTLDGYSEASGKSPRGGRQVRIPIRTKITLPYLFLALVLAAGVSLLVTRIVFDTIEERFSNQLIEAGRLSAEWMVREEDSLLETLRILARTTGVPDLVQSGDAEGLRQSTFGVVVNNQEDAVLFLDAQGSLVLSMVHRQGEGLEAYDFVRGGGQEFTDWGAVAKVLAGEQDLHGDKFAAFEIFNEDYYFFTTGPIFDEAGELAGVVLVGKSLDEMVAKLQQETRIQVTIYDFDGQPMESTFLSSPSLPPETASQILLDQDTASQRRDLSSRRDITVSNIDYEEILGPWEAREGEDLGVVGSALPKTFLVRANSVTRLQIFLLVAFAFLLVTLVGLYISALITRPIQGLVNASSRVAEGDLEVQLRVRSQDEIEDLTESFNQMVSSLNRSQKDLVKAYDTALNGWAKALELRDEITEGHTLRVVELTVLLAKEFGFEGLALEQVRRGALLHDIGKMAIPDSILQKPGKLTPDEWETMRRHPEYAYEMLKDIEFLQGAVDIPYCHHEKWDGSGYPQGLKGEEIPLPARIFAIVDVWDALISDRPYREAWPLDKTLEYLREQSGSHFDPQVVEVFAKVMVGKTKPAEETEIAA